VNLQLKLQVIFSFKFKVIWTSQF